VVYRPLLATSTLSAFLLAGCGSGSGASPSASAANPFRALPQTATRQAVQPDSVKLFKQNGPTLLAYAFKYDGFTDPTGGQTQHDAAAFNSLTAVVGQAVPPKSAITGRASTYGGSPGIETNVQDPTMRFSGTVPLKCGGNFAHGIASAVCKAARGSVNGSVHEFGFVQSWPFYVDAASSSNVNPGTFEMESTTDDGAFFMLAPKAFTYAQPGNFKGATGLTAGTAVTQNEDLFGPSQATGTFTIAAQTACANNLYWLTWEYFEALGGGAGMEYSWVTPGNNTFAQVTQSTIWGRVSSGGQSAVGDAVSVALPGGGSASLVTDSGGCFGYNFAPFAGPQSLAVTVTDNATHKMLSASPTLNNGQAKDLNFHF
jgi:hypothetical protein